MQRLQAHGYSAFRVGGYVRNSLLGLPIHDIDITTNAIPDEVMGLFERTIPTGLKHGTVTVVMNGFPFEVTTFRGEKGYDNRRHPNHVEFKSRVEEDLARRDFTINAMAEGLDGKRIDPFDGQGDLAKRIIRAVGDPTLRMREDALRMLRAVRFIAQLGFDIESNTAESIRQAKHDVIHLSIERIREEWTKLLLGPYVNKGLQWADELGIFKVLFGVDLSDYPYPSPHEESHGSFEQDNKWTEGEAWAWAAFVRWVGYRGDAAAKLISRFRHSNKTLLQARGLLRIWGQCDQWRSNGMNEGDDPLIQWLYTTGGKRAVIDIRRLTRIIGFYSLLEECTEGEVQAWIRRLTGLYHKLPIYRMNDMDISGSDLIQAVNLEPGSWVKEALDQLFWATVQGVIPNKKEVQLSYFFDELDGRPS